MTNSKFMKLGLSLAIGALVIGAFAIAPCTVLASAETVEKSTNEVVEPVAVIHAYRISEVSVYGQNTVEVDVTPMFYHTINSNVSIGSMDYTYSVGTSDFALKNAINSAIAPYGLSLSVTYSSPDVIVRGEYTTGYYKLVALVDVVNVSYTVEEQVLEDIWRVYPSGTSNVAYLDDSHVEYKMYYYMTTTSTPIIYDINGFLA